MPTDSAEAILRAARRARRDAQQHLAEGDTEAAEALFKAIADAESELRGATARIRQSIRPLSVSGFGESHDRMNDSIDSLHLTVERLRPEEIDDDGVEDVWDAFVDEHPELIRQRLEFNDDDLIRALVDAIAALEARQMESFGESRASERGVRSSSTAYELAGVRFIPGQGFVPSELRPERGDVIRVGQALARLAREGRVRRTNPAWASNHWAPVEGGSDAC